MAEKDEGGGGGGEDAERVVEKKEAIRLRKRKSHYIIYCLLSM